MMLRDFCAVSEKERHNKIAMIITSCFMVDLFLFVTTCFEYKVSNVPDQEH